MREISTREIQAAVYGAITEISYHCHPRLTELLEVALSRETSELPRDILQTILQNHRLSPSTHIPLCQDTGTTVVFAEIGNQVRITDGLFSDAVNAAAIQAQAKCPLRASIITDPLFDRVNSGNNSPAVIHTRIVAGDRVRLMIAQKGGGAENMSFMKIFSPSVGKEAIIEYITEGVISAGSRPCPPLILGIGIGSNFEGAPLLAKKALFEPLGRKHPDPRYGEIEAEILRLVNERGCGAQGFGGVTTALAVHILHAPCHIASLPVAVNIQCHAHRHKEIWI